MSGDPKGSLYTVLYILTGSDKSIQGAKAAYKLASLPGPKRRIAHDRRDIVDYMALGTPRIIVDMPWPMEGDDLMFCYSLAKTYNYRVEEHDRGEIK